jgi:hypothetical protein
MNKICTSLEQSQKLIELGIGTKTADMYHAPDANIIVAEPYITKAGDKTFIPAYKGAIPAWSLSALLGLIPNWTMDKTDKVNLTCNPYYHCESCYEDLVDAAFEMICWLKKEEYI